MLAVIYRHRPDKFWETGPRGVSFLENICTVQKVESKQLICYISSTSNFVVSAIDRCKCLIKIAEHLYIETNAIQTVKK